MYFVVMVRKDIEYRHSCYGPFTKDEAKTDFERRVEFYGEEYNIYITKVENES